MSQIQVELQDSMGNDRSVADSAWTSSLDYQKKQTRTNVDAERVIKMLADNKHSVPFESVVFRFWLKIPIATDRQVEKHRISCLSLDNDLWFDLPKGQKNSRRIYKMTLGDFVRKWKKNPFYNKKMRNMKLRSIDETTGEIITTNVIDIHTTGVQPIFKFTFEDGYNIKTTLNHRYLTDNGWLTIGNALGIREDLKSTPNYFLTNNKFSVNGSIAHKDYDYMAKLRSNGLTVAEMAQDLDISYHTVKKWLKKHNLTFKKEKTQFKKGNVPWNIGLKYKHLTPYNISEQERINRQMRASGANSNFWKGGATDKLIALRRECSEKLAKKVFERDNFVCSGCGGNNGPFNAHHIIPVYADQSKIMNFDNLTTLCEPCHRTIHSKNLEEVFANKFGKTFITVNKYAKRKFGKKIRTFKKIINVEYVGEESTYDLEVAGPYHNFVSNGVVVHNSQNGMSGRYRTMPSEFLNIPDDVKALTIKSSSALYGTESDLGLQKYISVCHESNFQFTVLLSHFKESEKLGYITNKEYKRLREFYRGMLPQHNMTEKVITLNLRSFANFQKLRNSEHAQPEIQLVAKMMLQQVKEKNICPVAIECLESIAWEI